MSKKPAAKPSELVLLAVHNLEHERGATERDIVKFISLRLNLKPEEVKNRVKAALTRSVALQLISQINGRFKMFGVLHKRSPDSVPVAFHYSRPNMEKQRPVQKLLRKSKPVRRKTQIWQKPKTPSERRRLIYEKNKTRRCECCGRRRRQVEIDHNQLMKWPNYRKVKGSLPRWLRRF